MTASMSSLATQSPLRSVLALCDNTIKRELRADEQNEKLYPNRETRECSGHWVDVVPSPLPNPFLVAFSPEMAATLGIDPAECQTEEFVRFFSGDIAAVSDVEVRPWATPYAVSVFGQPIMSPDPFGRGRAYGDGRALSLGVIALPNGERWELQLKGSGTTPFSRNGDGRAVLRSSVREFLVSEAMHHLRVPTTRVLSLVASGSEYIRRMWYAPGDRGRDHPPNTLVNERCAITCRVAPSFIRVGHIELYGRRAAKGEPGAKDELTALLQHVMRREFPAIDSTLPLREQLLEMMREFVRRQSALVVSWLRVGYVQGNMNSDNCLLSGRTVDYGPFGFVETYEELWSPFTSDMERKFGFERQPLAAQVNVMTLARALLPLFDQRGPEVAELQAIVQDLYSQELDANLAQMRRAKLGLSAWDGEASEPFWSQLQLLMQRSSLDYTIFWRQLASVGTDAAERAVREGEAGADALFELLLPAFDSDPRNETNKDKALLWRKWLLEYAARVQADAEARPGSERQREMRLTSPKFIPREWMLMQAYSAAEEGDFSVIEELARLFRTPYDEHPELEAKYYRRTPDEMRSKAGVSYFSCSS